MSDRVIDVRKQANLSLGHVLRLCVRGVADRLLRSLMTLAVTVLAVAFFMFLLSESALLQSIAARIADEVTRQRLATRTLLHLTTPPSALALSRNLAAAVGRPADIAEFASVTGWPADRVGLLANACGAEQRYFRFFDAMPVGKRIVLAQKRAGRDLFRGLLDPAAQRAFAEAIRPMHDLRLPGGMDGFTAFLGAFTAFEQEFAAFEKAWRAALAGLAQEGGRLTQGEALDRWIASATPDQLKAWGQLVAARGFATAPDRWPDIQAQLQAAATRQTIVQKLTDSEKQAQWRKAFREATPTSADEKLLRLRDSRVLPILDNAYALPELARISAQAAREKRLAGFEQRLAGRVTPAEGERKGLSSRQWFLLIISFVVCMVGISNAMLMSITERFREIATMKCLGATDRYILQQFMLEAALQGVTGGLLGMLIGLGIGALKIVAGFGAYGFSCWPGSALLWSAAASLAAGVVLAVLASIYPAWAASRMAPMEAMRIE